MRVLTYIFVIGPITVAYLLKNGNLTSLVALSPSPLLCMYMYMHMYYYVYYIYTGMQFITMVTPTQVYGVVIWVLNRCSCQGKHTMPVLLLLMSGLDTLWKL